MDKGRFFDVGILKLVYHITAGLFMSRLVLEDFNRYLVHPHNRQWFDFSSEFDTRNKFCIADIVIERF
jgi:hypothetical protein